MVVYHKLCKFKSQSGCGVSRKINNKVIVWLKAMLCLKTILIRLSDRISSFGKGNGGSVSIAEIGYKQPFCF